MSQYILLEKIIVQNANAIAGFTWGFPAITHFLGFVHLLNRKLLNHQEFKDIYLGGCTVISHKHKVHTYQSNYETRFTQSKNPPYLDNRGTSAPIIEEGKMNMMVSLVVEYEGNIGNSQDNFIKWIEKNCYLQRLAGGTILDIKNINIYNIEKDEDVKHIISKLLPGFILKDRSSYLTEHFDSLKKENDDAELIDAWLDFSALKKQARPKYDLIEKYLISLKNEKLIKLWKIHLSSPYQIENIPEDIYNIFKNIEQSNKTKKLINQWESYISPKEKTDVVWEYLPKPFGGYLVPIMVGYKALTPVYKNKEIKNTRDNETDVCFVEAVHSVGEWLGVHKIKSKEQLEESLWNYYYEKNWYLCKQLELEDESEDILEDILNDEEIYF